MQLTKGTKIRLLGSKYKIKLLTIICVVVVGGLIYKGYYGHNLAKEKRNSDIKPFVETMNVQPKDMLKNIELSGQTVPEAQVDIAAKYAGRIAKVCVNLGDTVSEGQILVVQDNSDVDNAIAQNNAGFRQAFADTVTSNASFQADYQKAQSDYQYYCNNYQRYKLLYSQGAIAKEQLDSVAQQMNSAKAALDTWTKQIAAGSAATVDSKQAASEKARQVVNGLMQQRNDMLIKAPRSGVIGFRQRQEY